MTVASGQMNFKLNTRSINLYQRDLMTIPLIQTVKIVITKENIKNIKINYIIFYNYHTKSMN